MKTRTEIAKGICGSLPQGLTSGTRTNETYPRPNAETTRKNKRRFYSLNKKQVRKTEIRREKSPNSISLPHNIDMFRALAAGAPWRGCGVAVAWGVVHVRARATAAHGLSSPLQVELSCEADVVAEAVWKPEGCGPPVPRPAVCRGDWRRDGEVGVSTPGGGGGGGGGVGRAPQNGAGGGVLGKVLTVYQLL